MAKGKYASMSTDDFDNYLVQVVNDQNPRPSDLLQVPGVYEVLSEYYNNEVLDAWTADQAETVTTVEED